MRDPNANRRLKIEAHDASRVEWSIYVPLPRDRTVSEAEDGPSALEMFDAARPNVVVLDEHMPRMCGLEVARELRGRDDDVTLMLFSASVDPEVITAAFAAVGAPPPRIVDADVSQEEDARAAMLAVLQ